MSTLRLYQIQVSNHENYTSKMLNQDSLKVAMEEYPRGKIYDRNLNPLTGTFTQQRIVVFPSLITNKAVTAMHLANIIAADRTQVESELKSTPHYLKYEITLTQVAEIRSINLNGVQVVPITFRYAPQQLARHTIGFLGKIDPDELKNSKAYQISDWTGKDGLEKIFEEQLKGLKAEKVLRANVDGNGQLIPGLGYQIENQPDMSRQNLVVTIDKRVQSIVEKVMDDRIKKGAVVVMDADSGDILAMAGRPVSNSLNPAIQLYQPGSVFKIVIAAAAIEEGKVTPETRFFCAGEKDKLIRCWNAAGHGAITFSEAMAISCNPTFARVGIMLGASKIIEYAQKMGMDTQMIIGFPYPPDQRQKLDMIKLPNKIVNSSVGQDAILASPIQITAMTAVIANKGVYKVPRLVRELRNEYGQVTKRFPTGLARQVIFPQTARTINDMLVQVTTQGSGQEAYVAPGSAGKTGSAQVGKQSDIVNAWFTGYAPVDKPKYIVTVLDELGTSGGKTAAPVFKEIMKQLLKF